MPIEYFDDEYGRVAGMFQERLGGDCIEKFGGAIESMVVLFGVHITGEELLHSFVSITSDALIEEMRICGSKNMSLFHVKKTLCSSERWAFVVAAIHRCSEPCGCETCIDIVSRRDEWIAGIRSLVYGAERLKVNGAMFRDSGKEFHEAVRVIARNNRQRRARNGILL